jgi:integral membrane transport protein
MLIVGIVVVLSMTTGSADSDVVFMSAPAKAALGEAPAALLGVPPWIALMSGWVLHDDLAYDSTALWMHLSAGVRGRDDRLGRMLAAALWHLPVLMIGTAALGAWTGRWDIVPASIGAQLGLYGAAAAWSAVISALLPYEVNAPGESPLKSRTSGMILLASLVQMIGLMVIAVLVLPVLIGIWVLAATGAWQWGWALLASGTLWGAGLAWAGAVWGGRALDRRWVQVLATVRSWPGHADTQ